ncbi:MAG: XdhC family protein [Candidatus Auribacterota bacterium]|nr:XdhC family protein [Candidatus Auribacterota bacterium]
MITAETYREIQRLIENNIKAVLVSTASVRAAAVSKTETAMIVGENGRISGSIGGGEIEYEVIGKAREILREGISRRIGIGVSEREEKRRGMLPGGTMKFYIQPLDRIPHLCIFSGGAFAAILARFGMMVGFRITVIDYDPEFVPSVDFPGAEIIITDRYQNLLEEISFNKSSYLLIATRDHRYDTRVLTQLIYSNPAYLGIIFSAKKKEALYTRLKEKGIPEDLLPTIHLPAGLPIGAATMEEIALSVIAEIIKERSA